jgi:voltage-gated potassium channel
VESGRPSAAFRPTRSPRPRHARKLAAFVRDTRVLLHEFRWQIAAGIVVLLGGAWILENFYDAGTPPGFAESVYDMIGLLSFQAPLPFPHAWPMRVFFFALPLVSFGVLAESLVRFGVLFFNRKNRMEAWNVSLAATEKNHVVICGLGRIGFRIAEELDRMGDSVVAVEMKKEGGFVEATRARGVAVLSGDARAKEQLIEAGVARAKAVICATNNDLANVEIALTARQIQPGIRVVVRMFDAGLAEKFGSAFDMETFSTTAISAPVFAAAATDRHVLYSFHLGEQTLAVAQIRIGAPSALAGKSVREVEVEFDASVVALVRGGEVDLHPEPDVRIAVGDAVAVLASLDVLAAIERANGVEPFPPQRRRSDA